MKPLREKEESFWRYFNSAWRAFSCAGQNTDNVLSRLMAPDEMKSRAPRNIRKFLKFLTVWLEISERDPERGGLEKYFGEISRRIFRGYNTKKNLI